MSDHRGGVSKYRGGMSKHWGGDVTSAVRSSVSMSVQNVRDESVGDGKQSRNGNYLKYTIVIPNITSQGQKAGIK